MTLNKLLIKRLNTNRHADADLEIWVIGHSRSLKMVLFASLGAIFYSPSIAALSMWRYLASFARYSELLVENCKKKIYTSPVFSTPERCNLVGISQRYLILLQQLSYRKQIARKLRTQFVEGISVTLKSMLRVTQGHWKRNH